ncbi:MAG: NUDIX hydrolase [Planctomycetota bacterium]
MRPVSLEVLEDRTPQSRCDEGFLTLRRLRVRHRYDDGSASPPYACDVVTRPGTDAVAAVLWFRGRDGRPQVLLKEGVRPAIWLRRGLPLHPPDPEAPLMLRELVAGVLEPGDEGEGGLAGRASAETREEAGLEVPSEAFRLLGSACFPSPGVSDEKVHFLVAELAAAPELREGGRGDGTPMEEGTRSVVLDLEEAVRLCRIGAIPDMKTEVGLLRLASLLAAASG